MKAFFLLSMYLVLGYNCNAQRAAKRTLFFNQDTTFFVGCGFTIEVNVLFFTSDSSSSNNKEKEYYLAVRCASAYGKSFFKKGQKYSMKLSKNFKEIKSFIPLDVFKQFSKEKKFYYAKNIKHVDNAYKKSPLLEEHLKTAVNL